MTEYLAGAEGIEPSAYGFGAELCCALEPLIFQHFTQLLSSYGTYMEPMLYKYSSVLIFL